MIPGACKLTILTNSLKLDNIFRHMSLIIYLCNGQEGRKRRKRGRRGRMDAMGKKIEGGARKRRRERRR